MLNSAGFVVILNKREVQQMIMLSERDRQFSLDEAEQRYSHVSLETKKLSS